MTDGAGTADTVPDLAGDGRSRSLLDRMVERPDGGGLLIPQKDGAIDPDRYLRQVIALHFDEEQGTPYWRERLDALDEDPRDTITSYADLHRLPPADEEALKERPVEDFVPAIFDPKDIDLSKSSGTTGRKKVMPWSKAVTADMIEWYDWHLPHREIEAGNWLVIGPYGLYERILEGAANTQGGFCLFNGIETRDLKTQLQAVEAAADLDAATALSFVRSPLMLVAAVKGLARLQPTMTAVREDLASQSIVAIATAPPVVDQVYEMLSGDETRPSPADIRLLLLSGTGVTETTVSRFEEWFPNASVIPMYATSFTGSAFDLPSTEGFTYFPMMPTVGLDVYQHPRDGEGALAPVEPGRRGQVVIHRVGEDFFWPNQLERETARKVTPPSESEIGWPGIADIDPLTT